MSYSYPLRPDLGLRRAPSTGGFALVIALSLMAFVLLLLLSITTLVKVEQASAANTVDRMKARQAALLSLPTRALQTICGQVKQSGGTWICSTRTMSAM